MFRFSLVKKTRNSLHNLMATANHHHDHQNNNKINQQQLQQNVTSYATRIGINLPSESYLLPLAQEGLYYSENHHGGELPDGWERHEADDENRSQYFYNSHSGTSSWDNPIDELYKKKVGEMRIFFDQCAGALDVSDEELAEKRFADIVAHMAFCEMPEGITSHQDSEGRTFFHHESDASTTWNHPYLASFQQQVEAARKQRQQPQQQQQQKSRSLMMTGNTNNGSNNEPFLVVPPQPKQSAKDFIASQIPKKFDVLSGNTGGGAGLKIEYHSLLGAPFLKDTTRYDHATDSNDYDDVWGPPMPPRFEQSLKLEKRNDFDEWFGPPIRAGKAMRPEGAPKRVSGGGQMLRDLQHNHQGGGGNMSQPQNPFLLLLQQQHSRRREEKGDKIRTKLMMTK